MKNFYRFPLRKMAVLYFLAELGPQRHDELHFLMRSGLKHRFGFEETARMIVEPKELQEDALWPLLTRYAVQGLICKEWRGAKRVFSVTTKGKERLKWLFESYRRELQ